MAADGRRAMHSTPVSLLDRLRRPDDPAAWERFVRLYTPLLYYWARRLGCQEPDAADLVQDVLTQLVRKLPDFTYDPDKSFRSWLRTVLLNTWRNHQRRAELPQDATAGLDDLAIPDPASFLEEAEYRQWLVGRALELMRSEFQPATWKAFWECVVAERPAAEVARELGLTENAVYLAKGRVLRRLRRELAGLLD